MKIMLVSVNSKFIHKSPAIWCIKAYCEQLVSDIKIDIAEHNINQSVHDVAGHIVSKSPDAIGISCYIWNISFVDRLVQIVRTALPHCKIILGGPEVSYGNGNDSLAYKLADEIIEGEGEHKFCQYICQLTNLPAPIEHGFADMPSFLTDEYFASFIENGHDTTKEKLVYYESSRGCPFSCAYCLSSADKCVKYLPLERVKNELMMLAEHGVKCVKFVDRTFNADKKRALEILKFIRSLDTECTFHFEVAPDLFSDELLDEISKMPPARVQFEAGIQSVNENILKNVCRKTDVNRAMRFISSLHSFGNCHIHVDLIAGLPGETYDEILKGVDECIKVRPHMLQLGFLKLLQGSRLAFEDHGCVFSSFPPYEIIKNETLSYTDIMQLKSLESSIDKYYNSGKFVNSIEYALTLFEKPSELFLAITDFERKTVNRPLTQKDSYALFLEFLLQYGDAERSKHLIKLDCLSCDPKCRLPDKIQPLRENELERKMKKDGEERHIRAEKFLFDDKIRVFIYDKKDKITGRYSYITF